MSPQNTNGNPCGPDKGHLVLKLNGTVDPVITIKPGAQQFFRLINATGHKTLRLAVDGGTLEVVAIDGFALDSYPGTPPTMTVPWLVVPPASRAEFVVTGPANGHAKFRTLCFNSGLNGDPDPMLVLADILAPANGHAGRPMARHRADHGWGAASTERLYDGSFCLRRPSATWCSAKSRCTFSSTARPFRRSRGRRCSWSGRARSKRVARIERPPGEVHDFHIHQIHFLVESD